MFDQIIAYSIRNKMVIGIGVAALIIWGIFSLRQLPIDAVPDITNNQVQVITTSPTLATLEVEQFITTPVELALQNLQQVEEIRSVSRFGLSVVTVVFEEQLDIWLARQWVDEQLKVAAREIPEGLGIPEMAPVSTGLGEIYHYVIRADEAYRDSFSLTDLRTIQDWIVKRRLTGIDGVVEVNTLGGHLKQYEVAVKPQVMKSMGIRLDDIFQALEMSNENSGGAYIEKQPNTYYIRTTGLAQSLQDIADIVVDVRDQRPVRIGDVAEVRFGKAPRYGALTRDGEEVVGGTVMMLKGANSAAVTKRIKQRVDEIRKSLPDGVVIEPYLVRDKLITSAIKTVRTNLIEGGLIVIFILVLMLGNWRAGLIVASVIPLAMLFAIAMMNVLGISANLMSLGAIDFGLIVDGAVIIVEAIVHRFQVRFPGQTLSREQMDQEVRIASQEIRQSAAFGEIIILMVYLPILALVGIEGKMFRPMAQTVMLAIGGALILSLTYVPMMSALFLNRTIRPGGGISDRIIGAVQRAYEPVLRLALRTKLLFVAATLLLFGVTVYAFQRMGGEFIPTLEEGDFALHQILVPGSSLTQSAEVSKIIQERLMSEFPEVQDVVTKIGSSEIPTDPMPVETGDIIVVMKPRSEWTSAKTRQGMYEAMDRVLKDIPGVKYEYSQPIQMRFNELMTGSRSDIAVKIYGDDLEVLHTKAMEVEQILRGVEGVSTSKMEQTTGMPQVVVKYDYTRLAQYGLRVRDVNRAVRTAFAGETAGTVYEGDRRFDLVVRLQEPYRSQVKDVGDLYIPLPGGELVALRTVADIDLVEAPMQISRDNTQRRIVVGINAGRSDVKTLVGRMRGALDDQLELPAGYYVSFGGQFENLEAANARLAVAVPIALALIFLLLYFTFGSLSQALLIFTAIPLAAIGGVWSLQLRGMPFSISAGIGFIALFGVAVLNGIVLIGYFNQLRREGVTDIRERIFRGTRVRLRPVLMTASVASLGFLPMALSHSGGAEVQRPLATVVIGGLITATFLTLVILPILYSWLARWEEGDGRKPKVPAALILLPFLFFGSALQAQPTPVSLEQALQMAAENHPAAVAADRSAAEQEALRDMRYDPGATELQYSADGLFRENPERVHQLGLTQHFPAPGRMKYANRMQESAAERARTEEVMTLSRLRRDVRELYFQLQQRRALHDLYAEFADAYRSYATIAETRYEAGAAGRMEALTLQSRLGQFELLMEQAASEVSGLEARLSGMLLATDTLTASDSLTLSDFRAADTSALPQVKALRLDAEKAAAEVDWIRSGMRPDLSVGYGVMKFPEAGWLHSMQAGIRWSLFQAQNKQRMAAKQIAVEADRARAEAVLTNLTVRFAELSEAIRRYAAGAGFYRDQIERLHGDLARISELNYQNGTIPYIELMNTTDLLMSHRKEYLEQVLKHNLAVAEYQYLSNQ